ncbi:MAG: OmpH family outer membrane protein [Desulfobacterales bacterium]|nr:OmpH family outer membrane protein [Desulfobacterales bacterium]
MLICQTNNSIYRPFQRRPFIMYRILFLLVLFLATMIPPTFAADAQQIGIVDFKEFMERSIAGKAVQDQLKQNGQALQSELEKAQSSLKDLQTRYQRESPLWDQKQKDAKSKQFQARLLEFRKLKEAKEKEFNENRFKLLTGLQEDIRNQAEKLAKDNGYLLIIEKQSGKVLFSNDTLDVTSEVIQRHDKIKRGKK